MGRILIKNADIIDGSGAPAFRGAVLVNGPKIQAVIRDGMLPQADEVVDAEGLVVCPGFVDTHTHSDMILLHDPRQISSITQGVTTEIIGQDGLSYAPLSAENLRSYAKYLNGLNGLFDNVPLNFTMVSDYLHRFDNKCAVNVAYLVPHGALRLETLGFVDRELAGANLQKAKDILREGMAQGAKGFSTGLSYYPGSYCDTRELIELCKTVREFGGVFAIHLRSVFRGEPFDSVEEALTIARESGVKLHFSHYRTSDDTIGNPAAIMEKIDNAILEGLDITLETYPYHYGSSFAAMFLSPEASEGGVDSIMERLSSETGRAAIADYINDNFRHIDPVFSYSPKNIAYLGKACSELAAEKGVSRGRFLTELLYEEELALGFCMSVPELDNIQKPLFENDIFYLLGRKDFMVGSDAIHVGEFPHPRGYGCFAKLLRLAREREYPLHELINRMTKLPCRRFGLTGRGEIREGYFADIAVFNPLTITDKSSRKSPKARAEGVVHLFVNGKQVLMDSRETGVLSGKAL